MLDMERKQDLVIQEMQDMETQVIQDMEIQVIQDMEIQELQEMETLQDMEVNNKEQDMDPKRGAPPIRQDLNITQQHVEHPQVIEVIPRIISMVEDHHTVDNRNQTS